MTKANPVLKKYFDAHAQNYETAFSPFLANIRAQLIQPYIQSNTQLLDLGCGPGTLIKKYLTHTTPAKIVLCDISQKMLALAKKKLSLPSIVFLNKPIENVRSKKNTFDVIVMSECIYYCEKPLGTIIKTIPWLKPNGVCIVLLGKNMHPWLAKVLGILRLRAKDPFGEKTLPLHSIENYLQKHYVSYSIYSYLPLRGWHKNKANLGIMHGIIIKAYRHKKKPLKSILRTRMPKRKRPSGT